jgi:hypothetical protein
MTGRLPERDVMLLWLTHTTDIPVTELALPEIGDVLYPSGSRVVLSPERSSGRPCKSSKTRIAAGYKFKAIVAASEGESTHVRKPQEHRDHCLRLHLPEPARPPSSQRFGLTR